MIQRSAKHMYWMDKLPLLSYFDTYVFMGVFVYWCSLTAGKDF